MAGAFFMANIHTRNDSVVISEFRCYGISKCFLLLELFINIGKSSVCEDNRVKT